MAGVRAGLAAVVALAAAPACAGAHAIIRAGDVITFTSPDVTSTNTLTLRPSGSQIEFHDPTVDGGIDPGHCTPGELSPPGIFGEVVVQAFCPAAGVQAVRVDLGARDDTEGPMRRSVSASPAHGESASSRARPKPALPLRPAR